MGFSRQEYWSDLPCSSPETLPTQRLIPGLLHCRQILYHLSYREVLMLYSRTFLFIHPIYKNLHLLILNAQSLPLLLPTSLDKHKSGVCLFCRCVDLCHILESTYKWCIIFAFLQVQCYKLNNIVGQRANVGKLFGGMEKTPHKHIEAGCRISKVILCCFTVV